MGRKIVATPSSWVPRGEARCDGDGQRPLLVWRGIVGEPARIDLLGAGQHQVFGRWVSSDKPSPHRVEPVCERMDLCGGCAWMHLSADGQEAGHRQRVHDEFGRAGFKVQIADYHGSALQEDFRHVIKVGFGLSDHERLRVGAWGRGTRDIVPIPRCNVAAPVIRRTMASLAHHAIELNLRPYDAKSERGLIRSAVIRASRTTGEVLVTLIATRRTKDLDDLAEALGQGVSEVVGVFLHVNQGPGNAIFLRGDDGVVGTTRLIGKDHIEEKLGDVTYRIGPGDFFQTHPAIAETLYARTLERLALTAEDTVVDLYCGVGGFALQAAGKAGFVMGVEEVDGAIQRARETARANRLDAEFMQGQVLEALPELRTKLVGTGAKVVVDPARRGLEEGVLDAIVSLEPSQVAYVACNVSSLVRDVAPLLAKGWRLQPLELFAMFPHTPHVEVLAILEPPAAPTTSRRAPQRRLVR
jgi:23S rRNA (uracil1939-C5)-methyltransferase